ncbi:PRC-barrel domain-containing protein [Jatrophihabitans endophyticus]|uniref:PRC-barrel domain-containing protein n=1 Tax=Jatrophihabitans endophyticus TaxID=1206085 RepID=UPI0019F47722|nr:PRC-barrel domain-containing protein [Jatrophihabitans endophyticus]MBE7190777.1 PRC-barrel domain-containing protein [Jatrophihabitans endophyticus]
MIDTFATFTPSGGHEVLARLRDEGRALALPSDDIRGRRVCDRRGRVLGRVRALYIDIVTFRVREFLVGPRRLLAPQRDAIFVRSEAVTRVTASRVFIDRSRAGTQRASVFDPETREVEDTGEYAFYTGGWWFLW